MVRFLGMLVWLTYPILWCQKGGTTKHEDMNEKWRAMCRMKDVYEDSRKEVAV